MIKGSGMKLSVKSTQNKNIYEPPSFQNQFLSQPEQPIPEVKSIKEIKKQDKKISNIPQKIQKSRNSKQVKKDEKSNIVKKQPELVEDFVGNSKKSSLKSVKQDKSEDKEAKMIKNLSQGMGKLSASILQMKQKYSDLDFEELQFKKRNQKKEKQIKDFLAAKKVQRQKRRQRKMKFMEKEARRLQQEIRIEEETKHNKPRILALQHLKKIRSLKEMRQKEKRDQEILNKQISGMYSKIKQHQKEKPKFHLRKMQEDRKMVAQKLQAQRQYLQKRRQNFKPLDMQQLQAHKKRHEELLNQLQQLKNGQKEEEYLKILEKNKKIEEFYRGNAYDSVVKQYQERKSKRNEVNQRYKAVKQYKEYIRQNFKPRAKSIQKEDSVNMQAAFYQNHSAMSHREIRRYKYPNGFSFGQIVIEKSPIAKTEAEQRKIGKQYLAYMKSLPKRKKQDTNESDDEEGEEKQIKMKQKKPNPLASRQFSRRKSADVKISDDPTREQLKFAIIKLKNKDREIDMKEKVIRVQGGGQGFNLAKQKEVDQQFMLNIERKLNLLSKLEIPQTS